MGSKQDFEWVDTDGDGIPDIFDKEPLVPAKNDLERHLQDKRQDWHGPTMLKEKGKQTVEKCAHCEKTVINERLIVYQDFPLCMDCWTAVKHVIFKEQYEKITESERTFFTAYRNIRTNFLAQMERSDQKIEKISKKTLQKTIPNTMVCEKDEFKLNYADALESILANLINIKPELIFSLYFNPKIINITHFEEKKHVLLHKDYAKLFNLNGISIVSPSSEEQNQTLTTTLNIESTYGNIILEMKVIRKIDEITIENKYSGKVWSGFVEAWNDTLIEIFNTETQKIAHHLHLGDLYLSCAEVKEAQDIFYQICIRLKENQSDHLKKVYNDALAKIAHIYTDVKVIACPICFQTYSNTKDVETHILKSHQKKIHLRITQ